MPGTGGRTDSGRRLLLLGVVFTLLGSALVVRLGYWQVSQRDRLVESARRQISHQTTVPSKRGDIYDRTGTVLLAGTVTRERLIASGQELDADQRERLIEILTPILSLSDDAVAAVRTKLETGKPYLVLAQGLSPSVAETIRSATDAEGLPGIAFETTYTRYHQPGGGPGTSLAAQLIGFVNGTGTGQYGIEQRYQDVLAGTPRVVEADNDANGQPIAQTERTASAGVPGSDLRLTIDAGLQLAVEQEVSAAQIADDARDVSVVVMDPYTGAVYAEASYPSYDANDYGATADSNANLFLDPVVSDVYEPGSVFKLFTTIAALETGTANLQSKFKDTGHLTLDGGAARIQDADHRAMGVMKLQDAVAFSRNVVLAKVALGLAPTIDESSDILHSVWTRFGFGQPTGIDVSGEVPGLVNDPAISAWRQIDLANGAFGQGVAVTPIQLATAYAAMCNGGLLVQPHVVDAIDGKPVTVRSRGQVMDSALTPTLEGLMHHVLTISWYRDDVRMPGYWMGGKTGTAQIWDAKTRRWLTNRLNFSFVGFVGRQIGHPDLIVAVKIGAARPAIGIDGSLILKIKPTELFRRLATDAYLTPGLLPALPVEDIPTARLGG
jgi:cell division protein FtsI/penicillin-binding protein 2